jgi:hypothetical protein
MIMIPRQITFCETQVKGLRPGQVIIDRHAIGPLALERTFGDR